ncbi:MAG: acylphosphatase [Candidatus Aenigmatarchaeota archaeon]
MMYMNLVVGGEVQKQAFRKYVEGLAQQLNLSGFVYNNDNGSVVISCRGSEDDAEVSTFIDGVRRFPSAEVARCEEAAEPYLPNDFSRIVQNYEKEIAERLDEGVGELRKMNERLYNLDKGQEDMRDGIKDVHDEVKGLREDVGGLREDMGKYFNAQLEFNEKLTKAVEAIAYRNNSS